MSQNRYFATFEKKQAKMSKKMGVAAGIGVGSGSGGGLREKRHQIGLCGPNAGR